MGSFFGRTFVFRYLPGSFLHFCVFVSLDSPMAPLQMQSANRRRARRGSNLIDRV
jgi:hypothetical protein